MANAIKETRDAHVAIAIHKGVFLSRIWSPRAAGCRGATSPSQTGAQPITIALFVPLCYTYPLCHTLHVYTTLCYLRPHETNGYGDTTWRRVLLLLPSHFSLNSHCHVSTHELLLLHTWWHNQCFATAAQPMPANVNPRPICYVCNSCYCDGDGDDDYDFMSFLFCSFVFS